MNRSRTQFSKLAMGMLAAAAASCGKAGGPAPRASDPAARGPVQRLAWQDGAHYAYDLTLSGRTVMEQDGQDRLLVDLRLGAGLDLWARRAAGGGVELVARLRDVRLEGGGARGEGSFGDLAARLQQPWAVELADGRVRALRLAAGLPPAAVSLERNIAAALQLAPGPAGATAWTGSENDATGSYAAEYRALPEPGRFAKRKVRYDSFLVGVAGPRFGIDIGRGPAPAPPELAASDIQIAVDAGALASVRSSEELRATVGAGTPVRAKSALELRRTARDQAPPPAEWASAEAGLRELAASEPYASPVRHLDADAAKAAGWTFERAVAALEALERDRPDLAALPASSVGKQTPAENARAQQSARAFGALTAIFRQQPDTVRRAVVLARKNGPAAPALLDALSASRTAPAQAALLGLATDAKLPRGLRQAAAGSLIRTEQPDEATVAALIPLGDDPLLGAYATYGLGTFARKLREAGEVERAARISKLLVGRLAAAHDDQQKVTVLRGLANAGDAGAMEAVRPYLGSGSAQLRAAAVQALRLVPSPEVDRLIAERLASEQERLPRDEALSAASPRPASPVLVAAVEKVASTAPDPQGRLLAVRLLGHWLRGRADLRPALEEVARGDAEPKVREEARRLLARQPLDGSGAPG
jgi:hypothetical protein